MIVLSSVQTGKSDLGASIFFITEERKQAVNFTEPYYDSGARMIVRKNLNNLKTNSGINLISDLAGKKIGVESGVESWANLVREKLPDSQVIYYNTLADLVIALETNKIDGFTVDSAVADLLTNNNKNLKVLPEDFEGAYDITCVIAKNEKGGKIKKQIDEFIISLKESGELKKIIDLWCSNNEAEKVIQDYKNFPAPNGILNFATSATYPPFVYVKNNRLAGFEADILVRFCQKYGYGLNITDMIFEGVLPSIVSGKNDLGFGGFDITDEHKESVYFSEPYHSCVGKIIVRNESENSDLNDVIAKYNNPNIKLAIMTGSVHHETAKKYFPKAQILDVETTADCVQAVLTKKADGMINNEALITYLISVNKEFTRIPQSFKKDDYGFFVAKDETSEKLLTQLNEFILKLENNGTLENLKNIWLGADESKKIILDYEKFPAPNGILKVALTGLMPPLGYVKDNKVVGYDVDIMTRFCEAYGYGFKPVLMNFSGMIPAVNSKKCDVALGGIAITAERAESVNFTVPTYKNGNVFLLIRKSDESENKNNINVASFIEDLKGSFYKTFIREDRYKLFFDGIVSTFLITVLAILGGTLLGFVIYILCMNGNFFANILTRFCIWLIEGTPMVVLLMIFYYIIFGNVSIDGLWVSVIVFTLSFGSSMFMMIKSGVSAIDKGQLEAAQALGFTNIRAFFEIILPQAALHFMPAYKTNVVALIKATAIVGYIAVQDLTKMGDIVRSRTYEAFFPLIAVAVIYFILSGILNFIVGIVHNKLKPERRDAKKILKGIKVN